MAIRVFHMHIDPDVRRHGGVSARAPLSGADIIGDVHYNCGISVCEILPTPWNCGWRAARKTYRCVRLFPINCRSVGISCCPALLCIHLNYCRRETIHSLDESMLSNRNLRVSYLEILQLLVSNVSYCKHFALLHVAQLLHVGDNLFTLRLRNLNHFYL
jgi:hypothetical protein